MRRIDRQDDFIARPALEGLGNQELIVAHAIEVAGIEEIDAGIERCVDGGDALVPVCGAVEVRHAHAA